MASLYGLVKGCIYRPGPGARGLLGRGGREELDEFGEGLRSGLIEDAEPETGGDDTPIVDLDVRLSFLRCFVMFLRIPMVIRFWVWRLQLE